MQQVFLDPTARVVPDKNANLAFPVSSATKKPSPAEKAKQDATRQIVESLASASSMGPATKVGVDVELVASVPIENETFVERNFTDAEIEYCRKAPDSKASFAGRWSAKEAVFKSMGVQGKGAGAGLKDIEIVNDDKGVPTVKVRNLLRSSSD